MRNLDEFKERILNDSEFAKKLSNVKSIEDIVKVAAENNYNFTDSELENEEIGEDVLDAVAGGKGNNEHREINRYGEDYIGFTGTKDEAEQLAKLLQENQ